MEEFNIHEWQAKHLRNKSINEEFSKKEQDVIDSLVGHGKSQEEAERIVSDLKKSNVKEDRFEDVEHVFSGEGSPEHIQWKESRDDLMTQAEVGIDNLLMQLHDDAYDLGGDTNGPGLWHDIKKLIREKI